MRLLSTFSIILIITLMTSCNNDSDSESGTAPVITEIRNYAASPNDTLVDKIVPGQWIVITGKNLKSATGITFNGIPAEFNAGLFSNTYAAVQVPAVIPFPSVPANKLNTIQYTTSVGTTTFAFSIVAGPPAVINISNENPVEGDLVTISGTNLFLIKEINFGGKIITDYTPAVDGTSIGFVMPNATTSAPLSLTTASGTVTTTLNVNDVTTKSLCNFDNVNTFSWGCGTSNSSVDFPGNHGYYAVLNNGILNANNGAWWEWERSINVNSGQWVPAQDLTEPVANYAVKFEINVPGEWNGTTIQITRNYDFYGKYEPWKVNDKIVSYTTKGKWVTVTIPLSDFKKDGTQASSLTELLGSSGTGEFHIQAVSGSKPTVTGLRAAVDNIRVVKIN
ncbi:hypothetical protein SAMN05444671_4560 [Flavobacterium sp. CF108]|nr:hypothetical protein SAMN04487978_4258 [Flavobacterium sp. fv08]SHH97858.1 hypothetical protein SAMN05444671_4560 [Flavobacterium sp. CF108]